MVRSFLSWLVALFLLVPLAQADVTVGATRFPERLTFDGTLLMLNGAGIRTRVVFHVYAIGLYLPQPVTAAEAALASEPPRLIRIQLLRALSGATFADALIDGLKKNHAAEQLASYQASIDALRQAISAKGEFGENTMVIIGETREGKVEIVVGDQPLIEPIAQKGFFSLLLGIWLGPQPVQSDLKNALLKGSS